MALPDGGRDRAPLPATDGPFKVGHVWSPDGLRIGTWDLGCSNNSWCVAADPGRVGKGCGATPRQCFAGSATGHS